MARFETALKQNQTESIHLVCGCIGFLKNEGICNRERKGNKREWNQHNTGAQPVGEGGD